MKVCSITITIRITTGTCLLNDVLLSGNLKKGKREHNHPAEPKLYEIQEAKAQLRRGLERFLESPEAFIPEVSESLYRGITRCDYEAILQKEDPLPMGKRIKIVQEVSRGSAEDQVTIVKKETIEESDIKVENEEDPLSLSKVDCSTNQGKCLARHLRTITFPGNKNESDFIAVPSMFGGTKFVPKVPSYPRSRSGRPSSFSNEQIDILEKAFQRTKYPDCHLKRSLAHQIEQPVSRVQVRFFTIHKRKFVLAELVPKPTSQEDYAGQQACGNEPIK